jgi:MoaA/NifB/PqqE/SkfB family radical SAM enzyme/SAM-dependent methyltransferase
MKENISTGKETWHRFELGGQVLYVQPDIPDWIVLSQEADKLLGSEKRDPTSFYGQGLLENAFAVEPLQPYTGRATALSLGQLKECWFHLTDACNLSCRHCLFAASPAKTRSLDPAYLQSAVAQALDLGCRLFSFTGGEPFLYPDFVPFLRELLKNSEVHAAVLTNGMLLDQFLDALGALDRLHLQVSLDGLEESHDRLRGRGSYQKLMKNLQALQDADIPVTLSVAVSRENIDDLSRVIDVAAEVGAASIHLLYHFVRGKGSREQFIAPDVIFPKLLEAWQRADELGLSIDNIETMRSQVFATPGTRYDLSNTGWESVAVGPDAVIYPSPALVAMEQCACGRLDQGLAEVWKTSPVLQDIRGASLTDSPQYQANPLKFLVGGGDIDHSFMHGGEWVGHDPYVDLYNRIALQLIADQAGRYERRAQSGIHLRMGDVRYDCPDGEHAAGVALTHCNCLISLASDAGHSSVREFYGAAALTANEDIVNPLAPAQAEADFIPGKTRKHSYGCGSPVTDGAPQQGETLVDLGSGSGIECFMASSLVGEDGQVFGIDMTDEMLQLARASQAEVAEQLGYQNVEFRKGFLEQIPLDDNIADVVISNCVINLSPDKRMTYQEIFRILKPGGRLVVSDIVTDSAIPATIRNNVRYRGECLGGAMQQEELVGMMEAAGFRSIRFIKRFPYRQVENMDFFSLTYEAVRPAAATKEESVDVVYRGPFGAVYTESGILLTKGRRTAVPVQQIPLLDDSVFVLDEKGAVTNIAMENSCCSPQGTISQASANCCDTQEGSCCDSPEEQAPRERKGEGCMVCGAELHYFPDVRKMRCGYCGRSFPANGCCEKGHFVCDQCHCENGLEVIKAICSWSEERDLIALLKLIRSHPAIPMHGPEHHAMIPGIILACYRNNGGDLKEDTILTGISRGAGIPGGVCGFWGACGAAVGAGIAVSTILAATPLTPAPRQTAQAFSARVLSVIAKYRGGRCCQRETWIALTETAKLSEEVLSVPIQANEILHCDQYVKNKECIRKQCPLWENRVKVLEPELQFIAR